MTLISKIWKELTSILSNQNNLHFGWEFKLNNLAVKGLTNTILNIIYQCGNTLNYSVNEEYDYARFYVFSHTSVNTGVISKAGPHMNCLSMEWVVVSWTNLNKTSTFTMFVIITNRIVKPQVVLVLARLIVIKKHLHEKWSLTKKFHCVWESECYILYLSASLFEAGIVSINLHYPLHC